jgi:phosphate transport system substrate-binding protein
MCRHRVKRPTRATHSVLTLATVALVGLPLLVLASGAADPSPGGTSSAPGSHAAAPTAAVAAKPVEVAGSATFHPLALEVARRASTTPDGGAYHLRPTGTLAGIAAFCGGDGPGFPEIVNATRRMRDAEVADCKSHGVEGIVEVKVGYDGVALATAAPGPRTSVSLKDLYLALALRVPDPQGGNRLVPNPYRTWREVNPALPDTPIRVLGSAASTGTRDSLAELGLEAGCAQLEAVRRLTGRDRHRMATLCRPLRDDGAWRELAGTDADLAQALRADPQAVGVTAWHSLTVDHAGLKALPVEGVPPSPMAIATGVYALTRPIYVYFKKTDLESLPAIQRYVAEITSDSAWGDHGYLTAAGMVPMMVDERQKYGYIAEHWIDPACPPFCR